MPSSPRSIAGVPSGQALLGFPITAHHLCAFLLYLEGSLCGDITKQKESFRWSSEWSVWWSEMWCEDAGGGRKDDEKECEPSLGRPS